MATKTDLKAATKRNIRDKTAKESITRTAIADGIDAAYDYADQQVAALPLAARTGKYGDLADRPTIPAAYTDAMAVAAAQGPADAAVTLLRGGAPTEGNTLKKLYDLYTAIKAILGNGADADTVVNTVSEVLAALQNFPEGVNMLTRLASIDTAVAAALEAAQQPFELITGGYLTGNGLTNETKLDFNEQALIDLIQRTVGAGNMSSAEPALVAGDVLRMAGVSISATSEGTQYGEGAANAVDGDVNTFWGPTEMPTAQAPQILKFDFGAGNTRQPTLWKMVAKVGNNSLGVQSKAFDIWMSNDATMQTHEVVLSEANNTLANDAEYSKAMTPSMRYRYLWLRIYATANPENGAQVSNVQAIQSGS